MYESVGCVDSSVLCDTDGGMNPFDNSTSISCIETWESSASIA